MIEWISQPWAWYISGPLIALTMFSLLYAGKKFGVSSNLETICTIAGAGKISDYFKQDWRSKTWGLTFITGTIIGGFIAHYFFNDHSAIHISESTIALLTEKGVKDLKHPILPTDIFSLEGLMTWRGFIMLVGGGFLVGFGTRYAGGCTSGHAITGLSSLQVPSLVAVIGFFIGGLLMSYFLLPTILSL